MKPILNSMYFRAFYDRIRYNLLLDVCFWFGVPPLSIYNSTAVIMPIDHLSPSRLRAVTMAVRNYLKGIGSFATFEVVCDSSYYEIVSFHCM